MTAAGPLYFRSPIEAVDVIRALLSASDWKTLARYYDLSGTERNGEDLESGRFFREPALTTGPPFLREAGTVRPFPPGFTYERDAPDGQDRVRVYLKMEIDQGDGMAQRALHAFRLRKSSAGYQVLPDEVSYFDD